ncbi:ABC transporter substrate-binding protein [Agrobacterium rhizogenes]|uniref:ABC transporter substrate-binding protein n=1 Tax=Rhizobium rhizogenes TaxID=359 RepID=UPI00064623C0|nr:ABC transporter substrate-binding protein [Rhizobium rhizogenes]NTG76932.1 ABC transporter substrate-binding protein [Rhizobium rhizogenes]NTH15562.1 ABC transporter substrate-binding protein [Rhizobium rhizogenes]NTH80501.1 ABC transporter substrate-binding protein [Rhizobium rhizogenes]NTH86478.1 ABC transporter substrate-binding protein [Rhizobium rhizogenes]NTI77316.1 ABC transporter substrate-binding protein [Rhizobium rhizogenes]
MRLAVIAAALLLPLLLAPVANAGKANDTISIAFAKELEHIDPYFNTAREGVLLGNAVWDGLLYRDPKSGQYVGNLATSWSWVDPTTLELTLRQGVKFHNGASFDADDVVFTLNYMVDPKNGAKNTVATSWIKRAEKIDQFKVRIITNGPFPAALEYLAGPVIIHPHEYYAAVGPAGVATKPIGTGPYKVVSVEPGKHYVLKRNDDYFAAAKPKAKVETIDIRTIPDINTQMAELFNGTIDLVWQVPSEQADKMAGRGNFQVLNAPTMRVGYLSLDAAGRSGAKNPMTDVRVREAVYHAINRDGIVKALMKGTTEVINSACSPSQFGCATDVASYSYDPDKAKALLAEAGYPNGFEIDFYAYRDRPLAEAMIGMLAEVGIKANLKYLQYAALREKRIKEGVPMSFLTWGSNSIADASAITSEFFTMGGEDDARDKSLSDLLEKADSSVDPAERKTLYKQALSTIADKAYWVPLWNYSTNYIMSKDVSFTPTPDELVRFNEIGWK